MDRTEEIKELFEKIIDRKDFFKKVSEKFGMRESSVRVGWFFRFEIPIKYNMHNQLVAYMEEYIDNQKEILADIDVEVTELEHE